MEPYCGKNPGLSDEWIGNVFRGPAVLRWELVEAGNNAVFSSFLLIDNTGVKLGEMEDSPSSMSVFIDALKRKGVRVDEFDFLNEDVSHLNKHVTIIRGDTAKMLNRACESLER